MVLSYEQREQVWFKRLTPPLGPEFAYVAEDHLGNVLGFAVGGPERSGHEDYKGELHAIYLAEQYQRQETGTRLVSTVAKRLSQEGYQSMLVWVLADNPSRRFYEVLGGKLVNEQSIIIGGATLLEVAYAWEDISQLAANTP